MILNIVSRGPDVWFSFEVIIIHNDIWCSYVCSSSANIQKDPTFRILNVERLT